MGAAAFLPINHAVSEDHTKQHTSSGSTVISPPKKAIVRTTVRGGCQYPPIANPVPSIAEFQKNIDSGLPRLTFSFQSLLYSFEAVRGALEIVRRAMRGTIKPHSLSLDGRDAIALSYSAGGQLRRSARRGESRLNNQSRTCLC